MGRQLKWNKQPSHPLKVVVGVGRHPLPEAEVLPGALEVQEAEVAREDHLQEGVTWVCIDLSHYTLRQHKTIPLEDDNNPTGKKNSNTWIVHSLFFIKMIKYDLNSLVKFLIRQVHLKKRLSNVKIPFYS